MKNSIASGESTVLEGVAMSTAEKVIIEAAHFINLASAPVV